MGTEGTDPRSKLQQDFNTRLNEVVDKLSTELGITREEVLRRAKDFLEKTVKR